MVIIPMVWSKPIPCMWQQGVRIGPKILLSTSMQDSYDPQVGPSISAHYDYKNLSLGEYRTSQIATTPSANSVRSEVMRMLM